MASGLNPAQKPVANDLSEHHVAGKSNGTQSDSTASIFSSSESNFRTEVGEDSTSLPQKESHKESMGEHAIASPATCSSSYYYPVYGGSFTPLDDRGYFQTDGCHKAPQSENGSMLYYFPGYDPYSSGAVVSVDGQNVGQHPYYNSSGYVHHPVSYGSEALPCYSWESTYVGDVPNRKATMGNGRSSTYSKSSGSLTNKSSNSTSIQPVNPARKVSRNGFDSMAGLSEGYRPAGKSPLFSSQNESRYSHNSQTSYKPHGSLWNGIDGSKRGLSNRNGDFTSSTELVRGPRALNRIESLDSSVKVQDMGFMLRNKDQYNRQDFETEYTNAKFYVIKSYSEDDVHKSIKYGVWSSTPHGNRKLDAAFRDAEERSSENGNKCPVFLFFSVNRSGQFVGLAEMVGQVDFNKDMDFWQVDKWIGFFPVKWHIIKDIPHSCLQHIVLDNNDGRAVTYTRDTHEIGLKQGLEMLSIFKSFSAKTTLLDDFSFYEGREKSLQKSKGSSPATLRMEMYNNGDSHKHVEAETKRANNGTTKSADPSSLIKLTENLSLNGYHHKNSSIRK